MSHTSSLRVLDETIAKLFGSDAAILLNRIQFWLSCGYGVTDHQGKKYWYSTYQEIAERELTWLSPSQVKRLIQKLKQSGVLIVKRLQAHLYRQTNHYRINWSRLNELLSNPCVLSKGRDRPFKETESNNDPITEKTTEKTERESETDSIKNSYENQEEDKQKTIEVTEEESDPPTVQPDRQGSKVQEFHNYLVIECYKNEEIRNPEGYAQAIINNYLSGSPSSEKLYKEWLETGECEISSPQVNGSNKGKNEGVSEQTSKPKPLELKEWQVQETDTELIEAGYSVGDIYPEFVAWCVPRLKYHPDLSDYASKAHALKKLKLEPQLALELWRDFKRLLVREYQDKQKLEAKGQRYFTPSWLKLPEDVPVSEAREASIALSEAKAKEQQAIEADRQDQQQQLTAGSDETTEETSQDDEEQLGAVESAKQAVNLIRQHPQHFIGYRLLETAKETATNEELEQINKLIDTYPNLDIW